MLGGADMAKYILKRILFLIPVIIGITLFIYVIMSVAPGDPAELLLGNTVTEEVLQAKRVEMGLDKPVLIQYLNYMGGVLQGDFGTSWFSSYNVLQEFAQRLPNTLRLGLLAMAIAAVAGVPLGVLAAVRQYHVFDYITLVGAMMFSSMPAFWFGLMAQVYISLKWGLLPATGAGSVAHYILPAFTLAGAQLAGQVRLTRTSMLEVIKQDYVRTARAKGAPEGRVIIKHVLRNGMLPVATGLGMAFAYLLGGTVITESVFAIPGVGSLLIGAVKIRDVPVVMGIVVVIAVFVGVVNLLVDLLYAFIDPRVKLGYEA
jgi:peptide/nickel transport system permease protein